MRRTVFAPSFDREVEGIAIYIDEKFGQAARRDFVEDIKAICAILASFPGLGRSNHPSATDLIGFAYNQNWIFFEADPDEVRFLHVVWGSETRQRRTTPSP